MTTSVGHSSAYAILSFLLIHLSLQLSVHLFVAYWCDHNMNIIWHMSLPAIYSYSTGLYTYSNRCRLIPMPQSLINHFIARIILYLLCCLFPFSHWSHSSLTMCLLFVVSVLWSLMASVTGQTALDPVLSYTSIFFLHPFPTMLVRAPFTLSASLGPSIYLSLCFSCSVHLSTLHLSSYSNHPTRSLPSHRTAASSSHVHFDSSLMMFCLFVCLLLDMLIVRLSRLFSVCLSVAHIWFD